MYRFTEDRPEFEGFSKHYHRRVRQYNRESWRSRKIRKDIAHVLGIFGLIPAFILIAIIQSLFGVELPRPVATMLLLGVWGVIYWAALKAQPHPEFGRLPDFVFDYVGLNYSEQLESAQIVAWERAGLLPGEYDSLTYEDWVSGSVNSVQLDIIDTHLSRNPRTWLEETDSQSLFRGQLIRMQFENAWATGRTIVLQRQDSPRPDRFDGMGRVQFSDKAWAARFEAFSEDPDEAATILSADFLKTVSALEKAIGGRNLRFALSGGDMLIAVESGNIFQIGQESAESDRNAQVQRILDEIRAVFDIINRLSETSQASIATFR